MLEFRKLLNAYDKQIPLQGFAGASSVILAIFEILEISGVTYGWKSSRVEENFSDYYQDAKLTITNHKNKASLSIEDAIEDSLKSLSSMDSPVELVSFSPF
ncbi:MAG: hypothetical protein HWD61_13745 [Parachlamydiaceae bacterium]|nr:MAG: hypothetical protein HWD61_13745 [Parachlamydiaceae bacterium]